MAEEPLRNGPQTIEAFWQTDGSMQLKVGKQLVAKGKAPGTLKAEPGDSVQVGIDLIKPVGEYVIGNPFQGLISDLYIKHPR